MIVRVLFLTLAACGQATALDSDESDLTGGARLESSLRQTIRTLDDTYNAGSVPTSFAPDFVFMTPPSPMGPSVLLPNAQVFTQTMTGMLAAQPGFRHVSEIKRIRIIDGKSANVDMAVTVSGMKTPDGQDIPPAVLPVFTQWRLERGEWLGVDVRFLAPLAYQ